VKRLPPFFALRALEAAARHRSYSRAAKELAVTHGAVSQQIRKLEAELGARLFERSGNAMIPRPEAEQLAREVGRALGMIQTAVEEFGRAAEHDPLVVSIDPQFAARWLAPRLPRLLADPAGANLSVLVEERFANFVTDGVDLAIRYGNGEWEGTEASHLFTERLFVVCSPGFAEHHPIRAAEDLLSVPLIHHRRRPWSLWFDAFQLPAPEVSGLVFEDSVLVLTAAAAGLGVALGRSGLVEADLEAGRLIRPIEDGVASEVSFYAVWRPGNPKLPRILRLRDWFQAETAAESAQAA